MAAIEVQRRQTDLTTPNPNELVRRFEPDLWRYLRYLGAREDRVHDLTQDTFLAMAKAGFTHRDDAATATWLRRTARNLFLWSCRRERNTPTLQELDLADTIWERGYGGQRETWLAALDHCLDGLPPRSREAIDLRYAEGMSRTDIAGRLGLGVDGVKTMLRRVRAALRRCIQEQVR